ncbi:hypothetical protein [Rothia sp. ZJ1223]|uniref:hypothetical protein n=1 Tax=Rothia sp. ZJ1223 TaxID=2811098 RepID=UPI00195CC1BF|nr:hypothetical protein [Rothia sp. ZJ1223]MBM7051788.1 hypothetical protein [Rothia sp. ZJ1223]
MSFAEIFEKIIPVLLAGLFFGAGMPALYSLGMRCMAGTTEYTADGRLIEVDPPSSIAKAVGYLIFAVIIVVIVLGILWIAKDFIFHMTGFNLFGLTGN